MKKTLTGRIFLIITFLIITNITLWSQTVPRTLYAINGSAQTISKMNLETKEITQNILTVGEIPNRIYTNNNLLYIVNSKPDNIMIVDPADDTNIKSTITLTEGSNPWAMGFINETKAYITNFKSDSINVLDLQNGTVVKSIYSGKAPEGIIIVDGKAYVANTGYAGWGNPYEQATVTVIDTEIDSVIATVNVPTNAQDFALAPNGKLHVICTGDYANEFGKVAVIDIESETPVVIDTIDIGGTPGDIEISSGGSGYCSSWGDGTNGFIYKFDAEADTVINNSDNPILVGPNISGLFLDNSQNTLWIPYMTAWGGDGFAQQFSIDADSVVWTSEVLGNGTSAFTIVESFVVSVENTTVKPQRFYLEQNYPNPFNPTTTIKYSIPAIVASHESPLQQRVLLKIYDVLGKEVTTLVNKEQNHGTYKIIFDGTNLSSGIYYIQLRSGNFVQTRKMILMK